MHNFNDFRGNPVLLHSLTKSCQRVLESTKGCRNGQLDSIWSDRIHAVMHHRAHQAEF